MRRPWPDSLFRSSETVTSYTEVATNLCSAKPWTMRTRAPMSFGNLSICQRKLSHRERSRSRESVVCVVIVVPSIPWCYPAGVVSFDPEYSCYGLEGYGQLLFVFWADVGYPEVMLRYELPTTRQMDVFR
jgi:hypothetical protein